MALLVTGRDSLPYGRQCDEILMSEFMDNSSSDHAVIPSNLERRKVIPGGVPLLDTLRAITEYSGTWKIPASSLLANWGERRGPYPAMTREIETRELIIGESSPELITETAEWAKNNFQSNQADAPSSALAMQTKYIPITDHDLKRLASATEEFCMETTLTPRTTNDILPDSNGNIPINTWKYLPAKIAFGDGMSWQLILSFNIRMQDKDKFITPPRVIHEEIIRLLDALPAVVAYNALEQVTTIEATLTMLSGREVEILRVLDLEVLCILAGWINKATSLPAIAMAALGTPMNKASNRGDRMWGITHDDLPDPLKVLLSNELKVIHMVTAVLIAAMKHEIIADPEIVCHIMGELQPKVLRWWGHWMGWVAAGLHIDRQAYAKAQTREQAIRALRAADPQGRLLPHPPYRVLMFAEIRRGCTTITRGGPRFLHIERERFLSQYPIFAASTGSPFITIFQNRIQGEVILHARLGQSNIKNLNHKIPVPATAQHRLLHFHPALPLPEVDFKGNHASIDELQTIFRNLKRGQREGLLEWGRLNPDEVAAFFTVFTRNRAFAAKYRGVYEPLRILVLRTRNIHTIEVPECEERITTANQKAWEAVETSDTEEEATYLRLKAEEEQAAARMTALTEELDELKQQSAQRTAKMSEIRLKTSADEDQRKQLRRVRQQGKNVDRTLWRQPDISRTHATSTKRKRDNRQSVIVHKAIPREERIRNLSPPPAPRHPEDSPPEDQPCRGWVDDDEDAFGGRSVYAHLHATKRAAATTITAPSTDSEDELSIHADGELV